MTPQQIIELIPDKLIRDQVTENIIKQWGKEYLTGSPYGNKPSEMILGAFAFFASPKDQGAEYWEKVIINLQNQGL